MPPLIDLEVVRLAANAWNEAAVSVDVAYCASTVSVFVGNDASARCGASRRRSPPYEAFFVTQVSRRARPFGPEVIRRASKTFSAKRTIHRSLHDGSPDAGAPVRRSGVHRSLGNDIEHEGRCALGDPS